MPHTILEYSGNAADEVDLQVFWAGLHRHLTAVAPCRLQDIKSRAYRCEAFRMGDGEAGNAFAHLSIRLLEGRDEATLAKVGQGALQLLQAAFPQTLAAGQCHLTVELCGMRKDGYFKFESLT